MAGAKGAAAAAAGAGDCASPRDMGSSPVAPVPEHDVRSSTSTSGPNPFLDAAAQPMPAHTQAGGRRRRGLGALCCCFRGADDGLAGGGVSSGPAPTLDGGKGQQLTSSTSSGGRRSLASRLSLTRRHSLKQLGSNAYSDAEWYDAASRFSTVDSLSANMADVDAYPLPMELGAPRPKWVPDEPLAFAVPNMVFVPLPPVTGFAAYWIRDDDRTTPPPQPIDVMLKANFIVQKSHNSIPGVWMQETEREFNMLVKPRFVPPGFPRYQECYDKSGETEGTWMLRRDLKPGRSFGRIFLTQDGTLIFRVHTRPWSGSEVDLITEEYMRLEQGGQVLVARQCCLHVASGKRAVQYLVGRRMDAPPRGHV